MSKVIYDKKKYNQTYNKKLAEQEVYCDACCIKVKLISMPRHKQSKKHIEKANKQTSNLKEEVLALLNHKNPKKSDDDILKDIYYLIHAQFFDEEGEEIVDYEHTYTIPEPKTDKEAQFCNQTYALMNFDITALFDKLYDTVSPSVGEAIEEQFNKIDATNKNAKLQLLSVYRKIIKEIEPKVVVEEQKPVVKTIDIPKEELKPILKKKVEIVVEEEECNECSDLEDFMAYSKFIKLLPSTKIDYLGSFFDNFSKHSFDNYNSLYHNFEMSNCETEFNVLYREILYHKDRLIADYSDKSIDEDEEEEEEEEEDDY